MTTTTSPPQKPTSPRKRTGAKAHRSPSPIQVMGQCAVCHDFFTVTLRRLAHQRFTVLETPRLKLVDGTLLHRPDLCKGKVTLYGSQDQLELELERDPAAS